MKSLYVFFDKYRRFVPPRLREFLRSSISLGGYDEFLWKKQNPFIDLPDELIVSGSSMTAGILYDKAQYHVHWIAACRDLGVSYRLVDITKSDWLERVENADCDLFLVWPDVSSYERKGMFDDRLRVMVRVLGKRIYPSLMETWLFENKRVQHYWLEANRLPCPKTRIFYDLSDARQFIETCRYPIVFKTNTGGSASGVFILENIRQAKDIVKRAFGKGIRLKRGDIHHLQRDGVYFQEYLSDVKEWRMVRIGDSYFGHGKECVGQFHSGSHRVNWNVPSDKAFDLLRRVTDVGGFTSMDVDMFETREGDFLVNELQTVFGTSIAVEQMKKDGKPGRYRDMNETWVFEAGDFCKNHMCNLRLQYILDQSEMKSEDSSPAKRQRL